MVLDIDKKPDKQLIIKMAGYLEKKGRMRVVGVRRWKKRWCVLEGKLLLYFKTQLEYSHHLSPCRGSVNMGLVLSITPRGPCQIQIVTRSQIIVFRTKSKSNQEAWLTMLQDARNSCNQSCVRPRNRVSVVERQCRLSVESNGMAINQAKYGRTLKESFDDIYFELSNKNGLRAAGSRRVLRKAESDNRVSFYREPRGMTVEVAGGGSDKESCRSRSLSYESIYFKPQDHCADSVLPVTVAAKSRSCQELSATPENIIRSVKKRTDAVSKRMSRSIPFTQKHDHEDSDSDDYDYIEVYGIKHKYNAGITRVEETEEFHGSHPDLGPTEVCDSGGTSEPEELPIRKIVMEKPDIHMSLETDSSESDFRLKSSNEPTTAGTEDDGRPPPLPIKKKFTRIDDQNVQVEKRLMADGLHVYKQNAEEVIYDVPIFHGELIEHFRRMSIASPVQQPSKCTRYADNTDIHMDSLEPSLLYETLHMTPDSLEISAALPTHKRWSGDSGFQYDVVDGCSGLSPVRNHFEDSLEPVVAMIHHDRKIWQNVPNISSTDYFR
ncbi:uncharacterized protein LOC126838137 isoform X2 [Adelges cooleyi]|nr:uncharacterized protein LOC126838137 isoform X2 [Adelges cooleyi]XP_050428269.1 uncharacterized protein LOC126838137 isoform X2 [Adelges cooleyi]